MEHLQIEKLNNSLLLTLPAEFRYDNWSIDFGEFQRLCRNTGTLTEFIVDASHCIWIDPIPIMSVIICLYELPVHITKKFYLRNRSAVDIDNRKVMAFLEKEGFLKSIAASNTELLIFNNHETECYTEADKAEFLSYQNSLKFADATILPATIANLKVVAETETVENWLTNLLTGLRHRINNKLSGTIENEIYSKLNLFLKETVENIYEHAYPPQAEVKMAAIYIRFRRGLADNSLDYSARHDLAKAIDQESRACPVLRKVFLENINSFIEVFVLDAGKGLSNDFFKNEVTPKYPFREAWRRTIGLGDRGPNSKKKNTRFGGLFTIGQVLENNYLAARDVNDWIGDVLPIQGDSEVFAANRSYLFIKTRAQVTGLALIGRISWKVASDDNKDWSTSSAAISQPYRTALLEEKDIYLKYGGKKFSSLISNPYFIKDNKYKYGDPLLNKKYLEQASRSNFCLFLPEEGLAKNAIHARVVGSFLHLKNASRTMIIGDIPVWETGLYQYALEEAKYPTAFLSKYDKIILISKRLTVLILKKAGNTFIRSKEEQTKYIENQPAEFSPDLSLQHYVEWLRTHDSMIFWRYLEQNNLLNEYYLKADIEWYQGDKTINLKGYLNFSKTLTDSFCVILYENVLERTLALANASGCNYESIDVLTTRLCQYLNSIFYNTTTLAAQKIFLGSVFVSGYSEKASQLLQPEKGVHNTKLHFFYNTNTDFKRDNKQVMHLLLWPVNGEEWFSENVSNQVKVEVKGKYRRIGATHVIAPSGWKYFPVPRYKLINKSSKKFIDNFKLSDIKDPENEFISIYKCPPPETYDYWQGRKTEVLSYGHMVYENNHELLKIDFPYIIDESFRHGGGLAQFLLGEFMVALSVNVQEATDLTNNVLRSGVINYIEKEKTYFSKGILDCAVIVYPYHFNTNHAITRIKKYIPPEYHNRIVALFPVTKERSMSTFIPSPLTLETIAAKIEKYLEDTGLPHANIMLFDDSSISGKTRTDINHILYSLGVKNVKTVSMIERTRLPFSTSYPYKHKAYWRLDIPKLGAADNCPICNVLSDISEFEKMVVSDNAKLRLEEWREIWKQTSPFDGSENKPITPVLLNLPGETRMKKFGIYFDGEEHQQCGGDGNKIEISNSLGLSIYTAELHSMTSRDDIVLEYVKNKYIAATAKLEMVCTNILLFGREFSKIVHQECIKAIFTLANEMEQGNLTSYAAITLLPSRKIPWKSFTKLSATQWRLMCALRITI